MKKEKQNKRYYHGILTICGYYDMTYGIDHWDVEGYLSVSERVVNKILELHTDEIPSVCPKEEKIKLIFGDERRPWYLSRGFLEDYEEYVLVSPSSFPFHFPEEKQQRDKLWTTILVDYFMVKYSGTHKKNRMGKFGLTYQEITDIEQYVEKRLKKL